MRATLLCGWLVSAEAPGSQFIRCNGDTGKVRGDMWEHLREVQRADTVGRDFGVVVDPRSDSLEEIRQVLDEEVMVDFNAAVEDCVFGVISIILLTLPLVDQQDGIKRARELFQLSNDLFYQFSELLATSEWPLDINQYYGYRFLLGGQMTDCAGSELKVFIYNSTQDLTHSRLRTAFGMMGAGAHIHTYLEQSSCITQDPDQADIFFVPAYHGDQYNEMLETRFHAADAADMFPYLYRRRGMDHVFVVAANLPSWTHLRPVRHSMLLTVESYQVGGSSNDGEATDVIPRWASPWKDVMIPGYIDRWRIAAMRSFNKPTHERGYIVVFHGNHPGTHRLYVSHQATIRTKILDEFSGIHDCSVGGPVQDFFDRMGRSHFCFVPRGSSAWTIHLYESFFFGCIPVILSDEFEMPFQDVVDWPSLSIKWPMDNVGPELLEHLRAIPLERIAQMKLNLEEAACYFDYHRGWSLEPSEGDGVWTFWGAGLAALGSDCPYVGHGDATSVGTCRASCEHSMACNLVNYLPSEDGHAVGVDCVMRACSDAAQATLTSGAGGWEVWAKVSTADQRCSPYGAMLQSLQARVRHRPFTHGDHWR